MFCPLITGECMKNQCAWYSKLYEDTCVISSLETLLDPEYGEDND